MPKISQYPPMSTLTGAEILVGDQAGITSTATGTQLQALVQLTSSILVTLGLQATDSGAVNAYVLTSPKPPAALITGQLVVFTPLNTNNTAVTINYNGHGAIPALGWGGGAMTGGELSSAGPALLQYTGAAWQLVSTVGAQPGNQRTAAEIAAGVTPVNYVYAPGTPDRYQANNTPGTTDMSSGVTAANAQWVEGGAGVTFQGGTYYVASSLTLSAPLTFQASALLKPNFFITLNGPITAPQSQIFSLGNSGVLAVLSRVTGGNSYTNGTYTNVPLTGGTGSGAQATITVAGGAVTSATLTANGTGYLAGDSVSAAASSIGGTGSGFSCTVNAVTQIIGSLGGVDIYTRWYGDVADGNYSTGTGTDNGPIFQKALGTCGLRATQFTTAPNRLLTLSGVYKVLTPVSVGDNINWLGRGKFATVLYAPTAFANTAGLIQINGPGSYPTRFSGFAVGGQVGGAGGVGILSSKNACFMDDLWVTAFTSNPGIIISSTDNFLSQFSVELCAYGVQVTSSDVNITDGTLYQNTLDGIFVGNDSGPGETDPGRVTIENVRDFEAGNAAFAVVAGIHVTFTSCHAASLINGKYSTAAFQLLEATDVVLNGCTASNATGASTAPGIFIESGSGGCFDIVVNGCRASGFYDGLQAASVTGLNVTGGLYAGNSRNGVLISGGTEVVVNGVLSRGNTAAGIDSENTTAGSWHTVSGNACHSNNTYGVIANCGSTSFSNVQANSARVNSSNGYNFVGTVANILVGSALAASAGGAATAGTNY